RTFTTRPYTTDSQAAREAIAAAEAAIQDAQDAGASVTDARNLLENAKTAFNDKNFGQARDLAAQAASNAESATESQNRMQLLLTAGGVIVVLAVLGAVLYWYFQNRGPADKLG
ncbi:MAG: hypothetical protein ABEJ35_04605, partial [Halobacteriaceae archaeon]